MTKKNIKLAIIRSPGDTACPFGLPIPYACKHVGEAVTRMAPIDVLGDEPSPREVKQLVKANKTVMTMEAEGIRCPFAGKVFSDKKAVECNFGSNAEGIGEKGVTPSPFYSKVYDNIAYDGLYSYPMGWYGDNNISRNLYYGAYSLQGSDNSNIKKHAVGTTDDDIKDAVEHAIMMEDPSFTGQVRYNISPVKEISLEEILGWDDYSSWGEWQKGELKESEDLAGELDSFRPGWSKQVMQWLNVGKIPPVILVETKEAGSLIGDGRGRVSLAVGLDLPSLSTITMIEDDNGEYVFDLQNSRVVGAKDMEKQAGVIDMSQRFQQKQQETEQGKVKQQLESVTPQEFEQTQETDIEKARQKEFLSEVQQKTGVWMHRFSDVRKDEHGFFIFRNDNVAGSKMVPGHLLADYAMNQTPYWKVTSVQGERISLEPIGLNPFLTGVGAGGAKLTDFDIKVFTGDAERERVNQIKKKISDGDATIDDVKYLLDGTVPLQMGPNGAQGGWYNAGDRSNRGGRKGMTEQEVMMSDARKLQSWGFSVPALAISGELDVHDWGRWIEGNGDSDIDYVPKNMDAWVAYHREMTEKGKWRYDNEALERMRREFSLEKTKEYNEQIMQDFLSMERAFFKKKYPYLSGFDNLRELTEYFQREEERVQKRLEKQDVYLTEGEDSSEESIIKNVFNKERRVAIRNTIKLINMAREDRNYVKYLHDMMKMGGSDWFANEKVILFFEEIEDVEGLKYALEKLKDNTNRRYAYAAMGRLAPDEAVKFVTENDSLEAIRGLLNGYIGKNSPEYGQKMEEEEANRHMEWVQDFSNRNSLVERIKENIHSRNWKDKNDAEELLGTLMGAIKTYTPARWLNPEDVKRYFPQFYDFVMEVRGIE